MKRTLIEEQSQSKENDAPSYNLVKLHEKGVRLPAPEGIHDGDAHYPHKPEERNRRSTKTV